VALDHLQKMGVTMRCQEAIHQKYAIIDEKVVWYGSINLLSFGASQESIMRLVSGSVARALQ
jgi:phosphatidylserine/phosphatidylglycerophosphate/cardiolipin synthase-like enzyme